MRYRERIADQMLRDKLDAMGAVLIEGPKACGKTTTAEQQAKSIKALSQIIDTTKMQAPAFCMVLTGVGDFAYRRQDGIYVVPLGCLKD